MGQPSPAAPPDAPTPLGFDWSVGRYEEVAARLLQAAELLVEEAAPLAGQRVVDVGCGTGNAALLAAVRGARVTGVDPAPRLLDVARGRAAAAALDVTFRAGDAAALPVADNSADVVLSVFGVIFAPDPRAAAAELARVTAEDGRILLTAWIPGSAVSRTNQVAQEAVLRALSAPAPPPPVSWHDPDALDQLFAPHGFSVTVKEHSLSFTAASPREYLDREFASHPLAVVGRQILEQHGTADETYTQLLAILEAANEDPIGFRVTSRYITAQARRGDGRH
jgi:ubiquinone/menaquinone biosynthesis C-methylase UbiE